MLVVLGGWLVVAIIPAVMDYVIGVGGAPKFFVDHIMYKYDKMSVIMLICVYLNKASHRRTKAKPG